MKIILLKDIQKVGKKYDIKDVAEGYATNMLLPKGLAMIATGPLMAKIQAEKERANTEKKIQGELLIKSLETIKGMQITVKGKANEKGHLFAGITKDMVLDAVKNKTRLNLDPESIILDKPIKETGDHSVWVSAGGKKVDFILTIEKE